MLSSQQEALKSNQVELRKALEAAGARFKGIRACHCPFHEDKSPSAGIFEKDGHWFFKCHGCGLGGDIFEVRARMNKSSVADELSRERGDGIQLRTQEKPTQVYGTIEVIRSQFRDVEAVYEYTHPKSGLTEMAVIRYREGGRKRFAQACPTAGGFWLKSPVGKLPLYNRKRMLEADPIVVVEGEKAVHALHDVGITATTAPCGALNGGRADWTPLAGKTVILWADVDPPDEEYPRGKGDEHMRQVAKILHTLSPAPRVMWLDAEDLDLPPKGDASDAVARYREKFSVKETQALIEDLLADAEPMGIIGEYMKEVEATIAGQRRSVPMPWPVLNWAARALMPGKVMCLCGDGGSGKSLFMLNCMVDWYRQGKFRACIYQLEDDRNFHLRRVHAQLDANSSITDNEWVERNGEKMRESTRANAKALDTIGATMWEAPDEAVSLEMITSWLEERARAGFDVMIVDPVTAVKAEGRPWVADLNFITKCKVIARRYGSRVILITHPRTGAKASKSNHNDMAGGAAYPRFSHSVIMVERNDTNSEFGVRDQYGTKDFVRPNRIVFVAKARNGPGAGRRIAYEFNGSSLTYTEVGLIDRD